MLHWILRRYDRVKVVHTMRNAIDCDLSLLHYFEKSSLCLSWGTVNFVNKYHLCEHRSLMEVELGGLHIEHRCA